ncbi:MAG: hypothetical protein JXD22_01970 [Sedimentisphaerales bacterium]|nr:hypothetical protein [Sedimentisphaerales bacterium]
MKPKINHILYGSSIIKVGWLRRCYADVKERVNVSEQGEVSMEPQKISVVSKIYFMVFFLCWAIPTRAQSLANSFRDDFSKDLSSWQSPLGKGDWFIGDKVLHAKGDLENPPYFIKIQPVANVVFETTLRVEGAGRRNVGIILRAQEDKSCIAVRFYDAESTLELLQYEKDQIVRLQRGSTKVELNTGQWYRMKVVAYESMIMAKIWPAGESEPEKWQLQVKVNDQRPGKIGLWVHDKTKAGFMDVNIAWGKSIDKLQEEIVQQREKYLEYVRQSLEIRVDTAPFIRRTENGPRRQLLFSTMVDGGREPIGGELIVTWGKSHREKFMIESQQFRDGVYELLVPEPGLATEMKFLYKATVGKTYEITRKVEPVRKWTFYMTHHVHYDPGYTARQPEVIESCSEDMLRVVQYCKESANWPEESQFRWTVEGTALLKRFIDRHTEEEIKEFMELVHAGRIEICGYYMNIATEHCGHEQLIRCLYDAQKIRDKYGITINTATLNDTPGYTWALADLFAQVGITRLALRSNSIRGLFTWDREGAVPRPCYWEGPAGNKVFMWYTDSYREGDFFRAPGLHEGNFLAHIRRNENAGTWVDDIQLRMGGDNLPPNFQLSKNARAWNEKYVWPKVIVSTNRMYMEHLEKRYGKQCKTFRGDITSWWAEGPGSAAKETGMVRLAHDELVANEALWTKAWLSDPSVTYPHDKINSAYDDTICFDEHTWGASGSIPNAYTDFTLDQWKYKGSHAYNAKKKADNIQELVLEKLSETVYGSGRYNVAVWNTLTWQRTDVVEVNLINTPLDGARAITVTDTRTGKAVPAQISRDRISMFFLAQDMPPLDGVVFTVERTAKGKTPETKSGTIENRFYRLTASPESGGLVSWYDKELDRELLDTKADFRGNQAFYDKPIGGRDAINRKRPVSFDRTVVKTAGLRSQVTGPLFQEMTLDSSLPGCSRILQTVRIYNDLKMVDVINTVVKEEVLEPEGVYFAFPFNVPSPEFHLQIADAIMRPGEEQLTYTCQDFYAIQQWVDVNGDGFGIVFAPLEGNVISASDVNSYKWADRIEFNRGHIYSLALNNYWYTNFKATQNGELVFRYRITSYEGDYDPIRATRFAWQPFYPPLPIWVPSAKKSYIPDAKSWISVKGDQVVVSCIKLSEKGDAVIVRLLEQRGKSAKSTLQFNLPNKRSFTKAYTANAVEVPRNDLMVRNNAVTVELQPYEIATIGLVPNKIR